MKTATKTKPKSRQRSKAKYGYRFGKATVKYSISKTLSNALDDWQLGKLTPDIEDAIRNYHRISESMQAFPKLHECKTALEELDKTSKRLIWLLGKSGLDSGSTLILSDMADLSKPVISFSKLEKRLSSDLDKLSTLTVEAIKNIPAQKTGRIKKKPALDFLSEQLAIIFLKNNIPISTTKDSLFVDVIEAVLAEIGKRNAGLLTTQMAKRGKDYLSNPHRA